MTQPSLSETLADWAARPRPLTQPMADKCRELVIDVSGLCLAARRADYVAAVSGPLAEGRATVIGHPRQLTYPDAALVNGTAAHGEDFDDTFEGGPIHAGAIIVPAVFATAQRYRLSSERVGWGIAVGIETMCRLASVAPKAIHKAGFHPTSVIGAMGAALGVSAALGSDRASSARALGIAGSFASGIIEYLGDASWTKRLHAGWAAQSGIRAAELARSGFIGPRHVIEGEHGFFKAFAPSVSPDYNKLTAGLGEQWLAEAIAIRPYPCAAMAQPYIDCAITLARQGIMAERIRAIDCETAQDIVPRFWEPLDAKRTPSSAIAAKSSVPFCVALGLVRQSAHLADFSAASVEDPKLLAVADKVGYVIDADNPYPDAFTGHVRVELIDGTTLETRQDHMRGGKAEPLKATEVDEKFLANAAYGGVVNTRLLLDNCKAILEPGNDAWRRIGALAVKDATDD